MEDWMIVVGAFALMLAALLGLIEERNKRHGFRTIPEDDEDDDY